MATRKTAPEAAPGGTRRRGAALEDAVLVAAWDVLVELGYGGFTFEAVAARAGTSRPVLARRWAQRGDLLVAAVTRHLQRHPVKLPDTGRLRDDAIGMLRNANAARARTTALILAPLMDYFRDSGSSLALLQHGFHQDAASPFETIVARAVERGELRRIPRSARVVNLPLDLLRQEIFTTLKAVPDEAIAEIVDDVWLPLLRSTGRRAS